MKCATVAFLFLASLAASSPLELDKPQQAGFMNSLIRMLPDSYKISPITTTDATPKIRANATRKLIRYGPFTLPPNKDDIVAPKEGGHSHGGSSGGMAGMPGMSKKPTQPGAWEVITTAFQTLFALKPMDPNGFSLMKMINPGAMCKDCTVLGGKMSVIFENGTRANIKSGVYLHHAITVDLSKASKGFVSACPPKNGVMKGVSAVPGSIFIGGAVDDFTQLYTTPNGTFNSGYYIKDNNFMMQAEMINYHKSEQKIFIQVDLEYLPGKQGFDAEQGGLSAMGCDGNLAPWKPEKNTSGAVSQEGMQVLRDGHIVLARGHMHDGGTGINMYINEKLYCASNALYGGPGGTLTVDGQTWATIATMEECNNPIPVKKGDKVKIEATYDLKKHPLRESKGVEQENMAIMTMVFAPLE